MINEVVRAKNAHTEISEGMTFKKTEKEIIKAIVKYGGEVKSLVDVLNESKILEKRGIVIMPHEERCYIFLHKYRNLKCNTIPRQGLSQYCSLAILSNAYPLAYITQTSHIFLSNNIVFNIEGIGGFYNMTPRLNLYYSQIFPRKDPDYDKKNYKYFTKGDYNLNIIGVRAKETKVTNKYDVFELKGMIQEHVNYTNSEKGKMILDNFKEYLPKFKKIIPHDYHRMLMTIVQMEEKGLSSEQAQIEAFYANRNK